VAATRRRRRDSSPRPGSVGRVRLLEGAAPARRHAGAAFGDELGTLLDLGEIFDGGGAGP